jgi:hypothetical protein
MNYRGYIISIVKWRNVRERWVVNDVTWDTEENVETTTTKTVMIVDVSCGIRNGDAPNVKQESYLLHWNVR